MTSIDEIANGAVSGDLNDKVQEEPDQVALAIDILQRARLLLLELEAFEKHLASGPRIKDTFANQRRNLAHGGVDSTKFGKFKEEVQHEIKTMDKLLLQEENLRHHGFSSNFIYYEYIWITAKQSTGVTALRQKFYCSEYTRDKDSGRSTKVVVDVVADDDSTWVKVYPRKESTILHDLAKVGWMGEASDEDENGEPLIGMDTESDPDLLRQVKILISAAKVTRVKYQNPQILVVLPRVPRTCSTEVSIMLDKIRALGVRIQTSEDNSPAPPLAAVVHTMTVDYAADLTDTLNLDCTMLFAFTSDLSHGPLEPQDWHHGFLQDQMENEEKSKLLPETIWPACGGRNLVCTRPAMLKAFEISNTLGTETEKARMDLLFNTSLTREELIQNFQALSAYLIPSVWQLPIRVVDVDIASLKFALLPPPKVDRKEFPESAVEIYEGVLLYGWAENITTMSSNEGRAKAVQRLIDQNSDEAGVKGPRVWIFSPRSLVGTPVDQAWKAARKTTQRETRKAEARRALSDEQGQVLDKGDTPPGNEALASQV